MFSSSKRNEMIQRMNDTTYDLLVIGGGITGAGIALDAASRGLKVALVEMQDFASGTSSRSTKLIHGGLRYLKQFEFKIVSEVGKERAIVYENGPHVTTPEWMILPFYRGSSLGKLTTNIGLKVYDFLAGVKKEEQRIMLSREEALAKEPLLKEEGLLGAGYYVEYKTDDARLTIEVMKKAVEFGVHAINYMKVIGLNYDSSGNINGVRTENQIDKTQFEIFAKKVVNATGPWVDSLREMDQSKREKALHLTKGVHIVFSKKDFPLKHAIYFDSADGRMIFAIPRGEKTYVGTTDTDYDGDIRSPVMLEEDLHYLLNATNDMFPSLKLHAGHVESSWAGLRPLIAEIGVDKPSEISRKNEIFISHSGLFSIAGGKLTGYRKMAEQIVDQIVDQWKEEFGILFTVSETKQIPISGGDVGGSRGFPLFLNTKVKQAREIGLDKETAIQWIRRYGSNVDILFQLYRENYEKAIVENIAPNLFAELIYGIEYELVYHPADFFIRRTGAMFFDIALVKQEKDTVINYMAKHLLWSKQEKEKYEKEMNQFILDTTS